MSGAAGWLARVQEALGRTDIMVVSSLRADGSPWTWPVQFQHTPRPGGCLDLQFSSLPTAEHVAHLATDPRVAVAVFAVPGPPGGNLGLQLRIADVKRHAGNRFGWQVGRVQKNDRLPTVQLCRVIRGPGPPVASS